MTTREPYRAQRVGNLRERITIQQYKETSDGHGGFDYEWLDLATVWCRVEPLKGEERVIAAAVRNPYSVTFHIRYRNGINTDMRIQYQDELFNIKRVTNYDERGRFLSIEAETGA